MTITNIRRLCGWISVLFFAAAAVTANAAEPIKQIPAGTIVRDSESSAWNRVVLVAVPRIATGDVDALTSYVRDAVSQLHLTIMATIKRDLTSGSFQLTDVGIGYSTLIGGRPTVIDSENASRLGADLGFTGGRMLATNEAQLSKVRVVVRSTTLTLFDTPAIYHRHGKHENFQARHLIWVDTKSGKLMLANWLLVENVRGDLSTTTDSIRMIAAGTQEDRRIHVDGNAFNFLGIPSESAFAVEELPPGRDIPWSDELRTCSSHRSYDAVRLRTLTKAINNAVTTVR